MRRDFISMNTQNASSILKSKLTVRQMAVTALVTALLCILGPASIPVGAVPLSMTNFVLYLAVYLLGTKLSFLSYSIYLLIGLTGLPVFSGYTGGPAKLVGPTGGYLAGFFLLIIICGIFIEKSRGKTLPAITGMVFGLLAAYLFGTVWFMAESDCTLWYALTVCVFPFLIGDAVKIVIAAKIGPILHRALSKAHLLERS